MSEIKLRLVNSIQKVYWGWIVTNLESLLEVSCDNFKNPIRVELWPTCTVAYRQTLTLFFFQFSFSAHDFS